MLLGKVDNVVGLGEIFKSLYDKFEDNCSCGKKTNECEFWGPLIKELDQEDKNLQEKYDLVINQFIKSYGSSKTMVDSSKCHPTKLFSSKDSRGMQGLKFLTKNKDINLKVIHVVRDVRSWSNGLMQRDIRLSKDNNFSLRKKLFMFFLRSSYMRYLQWYISHKKIQRYLRDTKLENIIISYEDLALKPEVTLKKVCEFLEIPFDQSMMQPKDSKSHIAVGNPMRFKKENTLKINYDSRWFANSKLFLPTFLLRPVMKYNQELLYKESRNIK
jgi:hypothetical protein